MNKQMKKQTPLDYFNGDELAAEVWKNKYAMEGEESPKDMHRRMAKEFACIEKNYLQTPELDTITCNNLSHFGRHLNVLDEDEIFRYFDKFKYIIPQGSIMSMLGNKYKIGSLSNCFVIPSPYDSYGGIMQTDQELVQLMKRRGGVGMNINTLRPNNTPVSNTAGTSTGAFSFMHRYSNSTREVAQNGRRGALMLLIDCRHPDVFKFINIKKDRSQVTGANISVMLTNEFMEAVGKDEDFVCRFPTTIDLPQSDLYSKINYNELYNNGNGCYLMKIKAKELFDEIVNNAWENAEPGVAFIDRVKEYCPEGVYEMYVPIASNPCGEQWMQAHDACRLLALNLFSVVDKPFTQSAKLNYSKLYQIAYIQQRLADDIVDLEIEYVTKIIEKIKADTQPNEIKQVELNLWIKVRDMAAASRRTGCGFTGLGDMLAALNLKYDSDEALEVIEKVMKKKMEAELDCTIDLAILRGTFDGWDRELEYPKLSSEYGNNFYGMLSSEFPEQAKRMYLNGRRNVSWSTVAPTGTVSLMTQTTSGLEPLFLPYYMRRKKINPNEEGVRVDFVDQNKDSWQEFAVIHPKFKDWIQIHSIKLLAINGELDFSIIDKDMLEYFFKQSPWFGSTANDISWEKRIDIQAIIQKYTTNAISSTINLPNDVSKDVVVGIYEKAWKSGLKGVTIYRDGCRTGVLVSNEEKKSSFDYKDATKRPKELVADLHVITVKGVKYGVIMGLADEKPYELFAFNLPENIKESCTGKIIKVKKGQYNFDCDGMVLENIQEAAVRHDEQVLTRLVSGMLRHGAKPQFIMEQIDKCDLEVVSFGKAVSRTLKKYVKDEEMISRNVCKDCGSSNVRMQEGCLACLDCGSSKCG